MKTILNFILWIFLAFPEVYSQGTYFWSGNGKVSLAENRQSLCIYFDSPVTLSESFRISHPDILQVLDMKGRVSDHVVVEFSRIMEGSPLSIAEEIQMDHSHIRDARWSLGTGNGAKMWISPKIVYRANSEFDQNLFNKVISRYQGVQQLKTPTGWDILKAENLDDVLPLANELYETGMMALCHPDFLIVPYGMYTPPAGLFYADQFYLHNTGQNVEGSSTADVDIDAPEAWNLLPSLGSPDIVVAVIDEGVEAHEDLEDGSGNSRVLSGYTTSDPLNGVGAQEFAEDAHGQAISGIIAASHNNLGGNGIAPSVKILPVHIFIDGTSTISEIADGIDWAWRSGADVINNSWVFDFAAAPGFIPAIETALDSARTRGRSGKGCPIFFSAGQGINGNSGNDSVAYPANLSYVLAVGACTQKKQRPSYANYGTGLDVVAPTSPTNIANIRVMDRMGDLGYNTSSNYIANLDYSDVNYTKWFGGTSAACAQASGTAALLLSFDATMTESDVLTLIKSTATSLSDTVKFGQGILNAAAALTAAGATLPVEFTYFTGEAVDNRIVLSWETARELNNDFFSVERLESNGFSEIGKVKGYGTVSEPVAYSFSDLRPQAGKNIYRLRQTDFDGQSSFSSQVEVTFSRGVSVSSVWPNPATAMIHIEVVQGNPENLVCKITDLSGRVCLTQNVDSPEATAVISTDVTALESGFYFVSVYNSQGLIETRKFVKQN
ncbi:MAG: S8 family serine peptidase [Bacteroidia bacterium]